jgi:hypothetical protein
VFDIQEHRSEYYFKLDFHGEIFEVYKSIHSYKVRYEDNMMTRDGELLKQDYKDLLSVALKYGLRSFTYDNVVIEFQDYKDRNYYVLVQIRGYDIDIISSIRFNDYNVVPVYMKASKRINISSEYYLKEHYEGKINFLGTNKIKKSKDTHKKVLFRGIKKLIKNEKGKVKKTHEMSIDEFYEQENLDDTYGDFEYHVDKKF